MKKIWILTVLTIVSLSLFTACASEADTLVSPSPSGSPMVTPAPTQQMSPNNNGVPGETGAPAGDAAGNGMTGSMGMNGSMGNGNGSTAGQTGANGVTTMEDSRRISEQVAEEVEKLSELDEAEALVVDNMAVVSVKFDDQYKSGMDDRLRNMIEARVQAVNRNITNVYVVEEESDFNALTKIRESLTNANYTVEQLRQELMKYTDKMQG